MIGAYPFFSFPNFRPNYYRRNFYNPYNNYTHNIQESCTPKIHKNTESKYIPEKCDIQNTFDDECDDDSIFDFFGLKLHFDDILIITLLLFLYKEDVKDTYLYVALILLLIS